MPQSGNWMTPISAKAPVATNPTITPPSARRRPRLRSRNESNAVTSARASPKSCPIIAAARSRSTNAEHLNGGSTSTPHDLIQHEYSLITSTTTQTSRPQQVESDPGNAPAWPYADRHAQPHPLFLADSRGSLRIRLDPRRWAASNRYEATRPMFERQLMKYGSARRMSVARFSVAMPKAIQLTTRAPTASIPYGRNWRPIEVARSATTSVATAHTGSVST